MATDTKVPDPVCKNCGKPETEHIAGRCPYAATTWEPGRPTKPIEPDRPGNLPAESDRPHPTPHKSGRE